MWPQRLRKTNGPIQRVQYALKLTVVRTSKNDVPPCIVAVAASVEGVHWTLAVQLSNRLDINHDKRSTRTRQNQALIARIRAVNETPPPLGVPSMSFPHTRKWRVADCSDTLHRRGDRTAVSYKAAKRST